MAWKSGRDVAAQRFDHPTSPHFDLEHDPLRFPFLQRTYVRPSRSEIYDSADLLLWSGVQQVWEFQRTMYETNVSPASPASRNGLVSY